MEVIQYDGRQMLAGSCITFGARHQVMQCSFFIVVYIA